MRNLDELRKEINEVDDIILDALIKRMEISKEIAMYKSENGLPIENKERELSHIEEIKKRSGEYAEYAETLFKKLMELSKAEQQKVLDR